MTTVTGQITVSNDNLDIILFGNNLTGETTPLDIDGYRDNRVGRLWSWRFRPRIPRELGLRLNYSFLAENRRSPKRPRPVRAAGRGFSLCATHGVQDMQSDVVDRTVEPVDGWLAGNWEQYSAASPRSCV